MPVQRVQFAVSSGHLCNVSLVGCVSDTIFFNFPGNSNGDCHTQGKKTLRGKTNKTYKQFSWVLFLIVLGYTVSVVIISAFYDPYRKEPLLTSGAGALATAQDEEPLPTSQTGASVSAKDKQYAFDFIGRDSVYSYILGKNKFGQMLALVVVLFQTWAVWWFARGAVKDFTDDKSDWVYSWKCSRNSLECTDQDDLGWQGWVICVTLMGAHLLKDIINGINLLLLCGKHRHR